MRVAVVTRYASAIGGAQVYLSRLLPHLKQRGHEIACVTELAESDGAEAILPPDWHIPHWSVADRGFEAVMDDLRNWKPDVVLLQGPGDPAFADRIAEAFPTVFRAENYYGTCISGTKTTCWPTPKPCSRLFGPACLLHYFPRRCGGLNPLTMLRLYLRQRHNNKVLRKCRAIVTLSEHLRQEFLRHGLPSERVIRLPFPVPETALPRQARASRPDGEPFRLLFLGRMDRLKGGDLLLQAVLLVAGQLSRPIHLDFAGDGPERLRWERLAQQVTASCQCVSVRFRGWVGSTERNELLRLADLLVVPSVWPEPFGHVGLEAAQHGVPAVAFAAGGIPEWLQDGVTGRLAPANPPTVQGLADAIHACLHDEAKLAALHRNTREFASRLSMDAHVIAIEDVFRRVAR